MPKKIIKMVLSSFIIMFSFFYTNTIIRTFKENDPIYIKIKEYENISNDNKKVNIEESYKRMKKIATFDKNLMVFQEMSNKNKISYLSYIDSLGDIPNSVSLVFIFRNTDNVLSIIDILNRKKVNATFFLDREIFEKSVDIVKLIHENGNQIELLSESYSVYEVNKYNSLMKIIAKNKLSFCINNSKNDNILKSCESSKLYTINPKLKINNNLYLSIKRNLQSGDIIELDNSNNIVKELSSTVNYIIQKGKKIILLKNIIDYK